MLPTTEQMLELGKVFIVWGKEIGIYTIITLIFLSVILGVHHMYSPKSIIKKIMGV